MIQARPVNLDILRRTTRLDFYSQLGVSEQETIYTRIAQTVDSDSDQETYAFFGAIQKPSRTDVTGGQPRESAPLNDYSMSLVNATWEMIVEVRRDIVEDAKLDQIAVRARSMADAGQSFLDERLTGLIEANGNGYDGNPFWGGTHHGASTNDKNNSLTATAATAGVTTVTEFEDSYSVSKARLRLLTDDRGRVANHGNLGLVCMVPPRMERAARAVLEVGPVAGQVGNSGTYKGDAAVIVNPFRTTTVEYHMFVTSKPIRPVIFQNRIPWDFNFVTDGDDWNKRGLASMVGRSRWDLLLGDWKKSVRMVFNQ